MKITFKALTDFWHNRVMVEAGSLVEMTAREAKYLMHALEEVVAPAEEVPAPVKATKADAKDGSSDKTA